jgi:hypothetical protein
MSNEEIAVRLAAAILHPTVVMPSLRENVGLHEDQLRHSAEFAVRVYETVLAVLQPPEPA